MRDRKLLMVELSVTELLNPLSHMTHCIGLLPEPVIKQNTPGGSSVLAMLTFHCLTHTRNYAFVILRNAPTRRTGQTLSFLK